VSVVQKFVFNGFQENTYVIHDNQVCVIVDPGCFEPREQEELARYIEVNNLTPLALLLTHAHIDHVLGCHFVQSKYDIPMYLHKDDIITLNAVESYAHVYGFPGYTPPKDPDVILLGGESIEFGSINFQVKFTPGHAPGHVVFYNEKDGYVINGDVLFAGSFGRVDLPGGDINILKNSIHKVMFELPVETVVYCGHGPETSIGQEKQTNYILQY
jgi:glyoxylase-like metal-dependent hydrolase (beta-lactamase superfamily II)